MSGTEPSPGVETEDKSMGWLWFLLGLWVGGFIGATVMALMQSRRIRKWQQQLKQQEQSK